MCATDETCNCATAATLKALRENKTLAEAQADAIAAAEAHEPELLTNDFRQLLKAHVVRLYTTQATALHSATH